MSSDKTKAQVRRSEERRIVKQHQQLYWKVFRTELKKPTKYRKRNPINCGISGCRLCGNPRKFWKVLTLAEYKFADIFKEQLRELNR